MSARNLVSGTRRPDGSVRKPVKIRHGFKSEELGIPTTYVAKGSQSDDTAKWVCPTAVHVEENKVAKKPIEKKSKVQKPTEVKSESKQEPKEVPLKDKKIDDPSKELRKVRKALRQIEEMEEAQKSGKSLNDDQIVKLKRKQYLVESEAYLITIVKEDDKKVSKSNSTSSDSRASNTSTMKTDIHNQQSKKEHKVMSNSNTKL
eukprot:TRINITY_DN1399_c0_g1_i1.p1 TRINITY_DN1399_c0_g1~~TRINITY_DN1399_c0_g1_i1.p1  ORF type:complete len:203 (-),score=49.41 TRINITY_DN1399_c0_g1_i1:521-1129(-)